MGVGIGVIGAGQWGSNHVRVWHELGALRAVCDVDPARLRAVSSRFGGIEALSDLDTMLARPEPEAVVVATPAATHASIALRAMEAGKDVLVEKPMALDVEDGRRVLDTARRLRRVLLVGHVLEYHPAVSALRRLVLQGELGRVRYVYANRLNMGRIRTEESALWSFAPHDIAVMLGLLGRAPVEVACRGGAYLNRGIADTTLTTLRFPGDVGAHIFVSWLHPFKEHRFVVIGDRQMAVFDDTAPWPEKLLLYPHGVDWLEGQTPVARKAEAVGVPLEEAEPLRAECDEFLRCVATREEPRTGGASGLEVIKVLQAAQRSLEGGGHPSSPSEGGGTLVHPTATVDAGAEIGEGSRVWHYTHVMAEARVGRNSVLGQNVFVGRGVRIGDGVKVQNNVSIYEGVELEDDVFCGPSAVFTNVTTPRSHIERKDELRKTLVRRGATLGANSTIVCGVTIGAYALVGAGAVVTRDVPDHALVVGVPARLAGWVCECGAALEGGVCPACGKSYSVAAPE